MNNNLILEDPLKEKALPAFANTLQITHHSPTQFSLPTGAWIAKYLVLTQAERRALPANSQMKAGVFVNNALQEFYADTIWKFGPHGKLEPQENFFKGRNKDELISKNLEEFKNYEPVDSKDQEKKDKYLDEVIDVVQHGFSALEILGASKSKVTCEEQLSITQDVSSLFLPVVGRTDFRFNTSGDSISSIVELKTTYSRLGKIKKDGTRSFYLSPLPDAPSFNHLIQVAFYAAYYDYKVPAYLVYLNKEGYKIFDKNNCDHLTEAGLKRLFRILCQTFTRREKILSLFEGKSREEIIEGAIELVSPEFDHPWAWQNFDQQQLDRFKELWKVN